MRSNVIALLVGAFLSIQQPFVQAETTNKSLDKYFRSVFPLLDVARLVRLKKECLQNENIEKRLRPCLGVTSNHELVTIEISSTGVINFMLIVQGESKEKRLGRIEQVIFPNEIKSLLKTP